MADVHRRFGRVLALDGARLSLRAGEVHAVLGENGAGKTTLLAVLAGLIQPDAGRILLRGNTFRPANPRTAWAMGVGMVHQHFALVPRLSVLENLRLGSGGIALGMKQLREAAGSLMRRTGLHVPLDARVQGLGVGERQRVEVLKVLLRAPGVLILDEPTAVLAPVEVQRLLALLREFAAAGTSVVLVAHKLDEVLSVADRVTVLRAGRTVLEAPRSAVDGDALVAAMVGSHGSDLAAEVRTTRAARAPAERPRPAPAPATVVARIEGVRVRNTGGALAVRDASLVVHRGEVVGVAGVEGNGQTELARVLAGRRAPDSGKVHLPPDPAFIPQDRGREGLVADFTLVENVALALYRDPTYTRGPLLRWGRLRERTRELLRAFSIRAPSPETRAHALSGGNQQRVVVARELARTPELLVAENPTRGLDVSASAFVHRRIGALTRTGVVLLSTDLDEVLQLSDRIFVMRRGQLIEVPEGARTREGVGRMMLSADGDADAPDGTGPS